VSFFDEALLRADVARYKCWHEIAASECEILREERDVLKRRVQELETERDQLAEEYSARSYSRSLP
jgi:hypothetical protein